MQHDGNINAVDLDLFLVLDDPREVVDYIVDFYSGELHKLQPNLEL
jgi:hypothetical protein